MILFANIYPDKGSVRQFHKKFRMQLAHELVQPLLDSYANPEIGHLLGRDPSISVLRLKGKHHFAVGRQPRSCVICAYQLVNTRKQRQ